MALLPVEPVKVLINKTPVKNYSYKNGVLNISISSGLQKETALEIVLR
jgi:hypothetical protein